MKVVRMLSWLLAALPIAAAGYWASFAARLPEPLVDRVALGEVTPRWDLANWADATLEPLHVLARGLHLLALQIPGATMQSVVWGNVLIALLILIGLCGLVRRAFASAAGRGPLVFGVFGVLVCCPAFGCNWLYGERVGILAVPLLLVYSLGRLQGLSRFNLRALFVCCIAAAAPLFHWHGIVVATALMPAMFGAATVAGSGRRMLWLGALFTIGCIAAVFSVSTVGSISVPGVDWWATVRSQPTEALLDLFVATSNAWVDLWPNTKSDDQVIGGLCWLLPFVLLFCGNRSAAARAVAAPFWSCVLFGLLVLVVNGVRYDFDPPVGSFRESTYGAFLLPVGLIGLMAARFGTMWLAIGGGAIVVLGSQDWHRGVEALRLSSMRVQHVEAGLMVPLSAGLTNSLPVKNEAEFSQLVERKWIPAIHRLSDDDLLPQFDAADFDRLGDMLGGCNEERGGVSRWGPPIAAEGRIRSSLRGVTAQCVAVLCKQTPLSNPIVIGYAWPKFDGVGRDVSWTVEFVKTLTQKAQVRAVGLDVTKNAFRAMGPSFVMKQGQGLVRSGE